MDPYTELYHYGILGMHWGVRRFQNYDGTLTDDGRKRYSGNKGARKFINDAIADLEYNHPLSKSSEDFDDALKRWGKTAEDLGIWNDGYDYGRKTGAKGEQHRIGSEIYDNMPSQLKERDYHRKQTAADLNKNSAKRREKAIKDLDNCIKEEYPDIHKEIGTKPGAETRNKLIDAHKAFNEKDFDQVLFQQMDEVMDVYGAGLISKKIFDNAYDTAAAQDVEFCLRAGNYDPSWYLSYLDYQPAPLMDKKQASSGNYSPSDYNRLDGWYGNGPENPERRTIKHALYILKRGIF